MCLWVFMLKGNYLRFTLEHDQANQNCNLKQFNKRVLNLRFKVGESESCCEYVLK
jgi:hypothetical protein